LFHCRAAGAETRPSHSLNASAYAKSYWLYLGAGALIAAGFTDFSLVGFHFRRASAVTETFIPIYYAAAMGAGALGSLIFGRLLDRLGQRVIVILFLVTALFAPLVFFGNAVFALFGTALWGLSMGAQDSLLKAVLTPSIPARKRSSAFGLFDTFYGVAWFAGSALMGLLYDLSIFVLVVFCLVLQLAALPLLVLAARRQTSA
jgi:predicted MFS family arabinose efflux permease